MTSTKLLSKNTKGIIQLSIINSIDAKEQSIVTFSILNSIEHSAEMIEDEEEKRKLADEFFRALMQFAKMVNGLTSQIKKLRNHFAELLVIDNLNKGNCSIWYQRV